MATMSYCLFQNTLADLQDCNERLWDEDLSEEEEAARNLLIELCQEIASAAGEQQDDDEE
jgi:hypothetical protein